MEDVFQIKIPHKRDEGSLQTPVDIFVKEFERKPVDVDALRAGMFRFRFVVNGSQPGSVPDPKIVAAMLDLVGYTWTLHFPYNPN